MSGASSHARRLTGKIAARALTEAGVSPEQAANALDITPQEMWDRLGGTASFRSGEWHALRALVGRSTLGVLTIVTNGGES